MTRATYKVGICTDGKRHAEIRRRLFQRQALCGAGRIVLKVDGEFDPTDWLSCPRCQQLAHAGSSAGETKQ
jgi:hypothetical protein